MENYNFVINIILKEEFGQRCINKVKLQNDGRGYSSIHGIRRIIRPAFQMAVDYNFIRKTPFEFQLYTVVVNDSVKRDAIASKQ